MKTRYTHHMSKNHRLQLMAGGLALVAAIRPCEAQSGPPSILNGGVVNAAKYTADLAPGGSGPVHGGRFRLG